MSHNALEHGYSDAVHGRRRVLGSDEYRSGYQRGSRYRCSENAIELAALGIISLIGGVALALYIASTIKVPV